MPTNSMGAVAASTLQAGGAVMGVIPRIMTTSKPHGHPGNDLPSSSTPHSAEGTGERLVESSSAGALETVVVETMHERKQRMAASSAGFIGLPGGFGTFEEVMEMITWSQLGIHNKPVVLANANGFWDPIALLVQGAVRDGFISEEGAQLVRIVGKQGDSPEQVAQQTLETFAQMQEEFKSRKGFWDWDAAKKKKEQDVAMGDATTKKPANPDEPLAVSVPNLTFEFAPGSGAEPALRNCNLSLQRGARCLLVGANGAGKSTLLRILAGKRLCETSVRVFGRDVFRNAPRGITYLGTEWAMNPVVRSDIVVSHFLDSVGGYRHKARRDRLLDILDVDLDWHMHQISDGERRRVQLCMGLMEEWDLLLLDEVTVDLDVQVRSDLLSFLTEETIQRNATIICEWQPLQPIVGFDPPLRDCHSRSPPTPAQTRRTSSTACRTSPRTSCTCSSAARRPRSRSRTRRAPRTRTSSPRSPRAPRTRAPTACTATTSRPCCTSRSSGCARTASFAWSTRPSSTAESASAAPAPPWRSPTRRPSSRSTTTPRPSLADQSDPHQDQQTVFGQDERKFQQTSKNRSTTTT